MNYNPLYRTDQPKSQTQPTTNGRTIKDFLLHSDPICARCRDSYKIINDESSMFILFKFLLTIIYILKIIMIIYNFYAQQGI